MCGFKLRRLVVRNSQILAALLCGGALINAGCAERPVWQASNPQAPQVKGAATAPAASVTRVEAGPDAPRRIQAALIAAKAGDVIELGAGTFECRATLSLDVNHVTIRGSQGPERTTLSFADQQQGTGGEGLLVTSKEDVTLEDFQVRDARGDAIKIQGTKGIRMRRLHVTWSGGPKETNGAYGLYPVLCTDVVIEDSYVSGASDAGIYVGQSENIVVRRNVAEENVAGIEIENSIRADVYENTARQNAGGILVFSLPDLPKKDGRLCRVFHNWVLKNNHENFAPKGNTVATVPPGTGIMIMANDETEVFDNAIEENQTSGVAIVSYLITGKPINDPKYDPFCEALYIHDNRFKENGKQPSGTLGTLLAQAVGTPLPSILYDGVADPKKQKDGKLPEELAIRIHKNGDAGFANFDAPALTASAAAGAQPPNIVRDLAAYEGTRPALAAVTIEGLK
jgi:parallel beta-helix repeat protein